MNKILVGLFLVCSIVLFSSQSSSKNAELETITLTNNNLLVLNDEVNGETVGALIEKAKKLDLKLRGKMGLDHTTPIYLYLYTPGGSVEAGLQLIEALKGLNRPVHTIVYFAASMGFQIVQNLDNRYILQSGVLMSHRAAGEFSGSFGGVSPSQLDQRVHVWVQVTKELDENTVKRTNGKQTLESYQKSYNQELWLTGQESVANGYADQIVRVHCDDTVNGTSKHKAQVLGVSLTYELDNCPINSSPLNIELTNNQGLSKEAQEYLKAQFISSFQNKRNTPLPLVF